MASPTVSMLMQDFMWLLGVEIPQISIASMYQRQNTPMTSASSATWAIHARPARTINSCIDAREAPTRTSLVSQPARLAQKALTAMRTRSYPSSALKVIIAL
jgi:hypothetical protein